MNDIVINCAICADLMPLVKDDVASEESKEAVIKHIAACDSCASLWGYSGIEILESTENKTTIDDKKVFENIRKGIYKFIFAFMIIGLLWGVAIINSVNMFYNIIIMPILGACSYYIFRRKFYIFSIMVFVSVVLRSVIEYFVEFGNGAHIGIDLLNSSFTWGLIHVTFTLAGVLIAFLLHFAFGKTK